MISGLSQSTASKQSLSRYGFTEVNSSLMHSHHLQVFQLLMHLLVEHIFSTLVTVLGESCSTVKDVYKYSFRS